MQEKITVKGAIAFNNNDKTFCFLTGWGKSMFGENGIYTNEYSSYTLIQEHTIEIDNPNIDLITPQLNALDEKEKQVKFQYHQALEHIKIERNNLLAITNEVSDA